MNTVLGGGTMNLEVMPVVSLPLSNSLTLRLRGGLSLVYAPGYTLTGGPDGDKVSQARLAPYLGRAVRAILAFQSGRGRQQAGQSRRADGGWHESRRLASSPPMGA